MKNNSDINTFKSFLLFLESVTLKKMFFFLRYIKVLLRIIEWQKQEKHVNNLIWKETSSSYHRKVYSRSSKSNVVYYMNKEFKSTLIVKIPEKKFSKRVSFSKVARTKTIVSVIQKNKQ